MLTKQPVPTPGQPPPVKEIRLLSAIRHFAAPAAPNRDRPIREPQAKGDPIKGRKATMAGAATPVGIPAAADRLTRAASMTPRTQGIG